MYQDFANGSYVHNQFIRCICDLLIENVVNITSYIRWLLEGVSHVRFKGENGTFGNIKLLFMFTIVQYHHHQNRTKTKSMRCTHTSCNVILTEWLLHQKLKALHVFRTEKSPPYFQHHPRNDEIAGHNEVVLYRPTTINRFNKSSERYDIVLFHAISVGWKS